MEGGFALVRCRPWEEGRYGGAWLPGTEGNAGRDVADVTGFPAASQDSHQEEEAFLGKCLNFKEISCLPILHPLRVGST